MFSTTNGLLIVARGTVPNDLVLDYARYLTSAEKMLSKHGATDEQRRRESLQARASESGLPLE